MDLLATKLYSPPARPGILFRSRLAKQLNSEMLKPFTLISAPAGYGKTTLLSMWATDYRQPIAWLSLDDGDNDPVRFWRYVDAAIQNVNGHLGENLRPILHSMQPPAFEQIVTGFVNDIMMSGRTLVLVLEDYHVINNAEVHASVNFLLDNAPPNLHVMITTRSDRHCTSREGADAVKWQRSVLRTQGWITGLHIAALSLKNEPDRHGFVAAFDGDERHIAGYFACLGLVSARLKRPW